MGRYRASSKAVARHILFRLGVFDALDAVRTTSGRGVARRRGQSLADVFSQIYAKGLWIERDGQDSRSGLGSSQAVAGALASHLSAFLAEVGCRKLVDVGCGDFNWMRRVEGDFDYVGLDVVPAVIDENRRLYGDGRHRFECLDATRATIEPGDVALCREVLFHLSLREGMQLLANIRAAGFRHVVLTQDEATLFNCDITSGGFRMINLAKAPYRLPRPERVLADDRLQTGRVLGVWSGVQLPAAA